MKSTAGVVAVVVLFLTNCGGGSSAPVTSNPPGLQVSVAISPGTQQSIDQGETEKFTASVTNDSNSQGVSWSVSGSGCSGSACGTFTNTSATSATYNAPASVASTLTVTVKATSAANNAASASANVTVDPGPAVATSSLPLGEVGSSYSSTLQASGGTGNLSWGVASGTLPAGLSLNASSGAISGTPTTAGILTFTVQATDSASAPESAQKQLSITIEPRLTITSTSLPNGKAGTPYSATLQSSGGIAPVTWSVASGVLPTGLALDASSGAISGTPTTAGTFDLTVQAADSAPAPVSAQQQFSITIASQGSLTITTTSLPPGTVGVGYTATLDALYYTLPITWSVSSGALPNGLSLDSGTGVISGTPTTAESSNFTVMVTDSSTPPQTATESLGITINSSAANNTELSGRYAFLLSGYDTSGNRVAVAGSLVADGSGLITSGVEDINDTGLTTGVALTFSGNYSVGADNRGVITLTNSAGATYNMAIAMGSLSGGTAKKGSILEFDATSNYTHGPYAMSGVIELQDSTAFYKGAVTGNYAFGFTGSDMAGSRLAVAGEFTANGSGGITGGQFDADDNGTPRVAAPIANTSTYTVDTTTGRGTAALNGITPAPVDYVFYTVSASKLLVLSIDPASTSGLVTGEIDAQSGGPFSNNSLSGVVVLAVDATATGGSQAAVGAATFDGNGSVTSFSLDTNNASSVTSLTGNGTYSTPDATTGRFTLALQGSNGLAGYLITANQAFVVGADSGVTAGLFQGQSAGPFTNSTLNMKAFFGDQPFAATPASTPSGGSPTTLSTGIVTFDGGGNISTTSDSNELGTLLSDQTATDTYSVAPNGKVTFGSGSLILYIVSPTRFVTMSTTTGDPNPTLGFGRQ